MPRSEARVAVITGGAVGIGTAYGAAFAAAGYRVVLVDVDVRVRNVADDLRGPLHGQHLGLCADVAVEADVEQLAIAVREAAGRVDVLINNAAIMLALGRPFKPFEETSWEEWQRVFAVNVGGMFLVTRALLALLQRGDDASVINIGSDAVWKGYDGQLAYFASKGAVQTLTRCLARELGEHGIRVNCLAPGFTLSESVLGSEVMMGVRDLVRDASVVKWDQQPEDVAAAALFLAGDGARCISGQTLVVNRGAVMP